MLGLHESFIQHSTSQHSTCHRMYTIQFSLANNHRSKLFFFLAHVKHIFLRTTCYSLNGTAFSRHSKPTHIKMTWIFVSYLILSVLFDTKWKLARGIISKLLMLPRKFRLNSKYFVSNEWVSFFFFVLFCMRCIHLYMILYRSII